MSNLTDADIDALIGKAVWFTRAEVEGIARALLAAAQQGAPEGWKLVPVEPTAEMELAGDDYAAATRDKPKGMWWWGRVYRAMLAAAPSPQGSQHEDR